MNAAQLFIQNDDSTSMVKSAMGLGSLGALIGSIGGPLGAVVGGAIGGFIGALFGEPLDDLKIKMYDRMISKLEEVEAVILNNLESQIPKIEEDLIKTIKYNFNRNKDHAVKLLLESN